MSRACQLIWYVRFVNVLGVHRSLIKHTWWMALCIHTEQISLSLKTVTISEQASRRTTLQISFSYSQNTNNLKWYGHNNYLSQVFISTRKKIKIQLLWLVLILEYTVLPKQPTFISTHLIPKLLSNLISKTFSGILNFSLCIPKHILEHIIGNAWSKLLIKKVWKQPFKNNFFQCTLHYPTTTDPSYTVLFVVEKKTYSSLLYISNTKCRYK